MNKNLIFKLIIICIGCVIYLIPGKNYMYENNSLVKQKASKQEIQQLLDAVERDKKIYKELFAAGEFNKPSYNPIMKQCHEENADILEHFLNKYGWPFEKDYGIEAHEAAWFIAIHAISRPDLIKKVAKIMHDAWKAGKISGKYYANFYDRIELYVGRKQFYGTHLYPSKTGWYAGDLKDPETVNERRAALGLQSLEDWIAESEQEGSGVVSDVNEEAYQKEFDAWCKETGWRK